MKRRAYCKINLTLEILGTKRADGFHDIKSIMHKIPLGDVIELSCKEGVGRVSLQCDVAVCQESDNLAYKAAKMYLERYRENTGKDADVDIKLSKITPTGAGLGGGSADAATVLDMLNECLAGVSDKDVLDMAQRLGSDVPFCLRRYMSAFCSGRGELCRGIDTLPKGTHMVIAKPVTGINTKGIYGEYDKMFGDDYSKCSSEHMESLLAASDISSVACNLVNDFESVCIPRLNEIGAIISKMQKLGALGSRMSGSGSAVYGLFDDSGKCRECEKALKEEGLTEVFCFLDEDFQKMYDDE